MLGSIVADFPVRISAIMSPAADVRCALTECKFKCSCGI